ncbi:MAG: MFS transporter [Muribaculaceae bacterium]|nr:SLC45 family MFS transporter [Bacteroides sp.]MDE6228094.1 MFS transporter [Muribaculaceae bacterium]
MVGIKDGNKLYSAKNLLIQDTVLIVTHGEALAEGVSVDGVFYPTSQVVVNGNDTLVSNHFIQHNEKGVAKASFGKKIDGIKTITIDGQTIDSCRNIVISDYLSRIQGPFQLTQAAIVANVNGIVSVEDASTVQISNAADCTYETKTVLNSATPQYNDAGNWVGLLYAIQALGSVAWAVILPKFRSRKFSYSLSLLLAGIGFILMSFMTNQWALFIAFLLIGCGWAAMLAWPFTILTNSLKGGNIGAYLGLFNCTICVPQIIAALAGGWILSLMSVPGELAPEYRMMMIAGIAIIIGSICVFFIKEGNKADNKVEETPAISENI